jgi:O-antigen/teichoic acid export membrane protein
MAGLRGSVITLGVANGLDAALHFVIPDALVRLLSVEHFGEYRLLWLAASLAMLFAPLGMPLSLQYFLLRNNARDRCAFIDQTVIFMLSTASIAALCFLPSSPQFWRSRE